MQSDERDSQAVIRSKNLLESLSLYQWREAMLFVHCKRYVQPRDMHDKQPCEESPNSVPHIGTAYRLNLLGAMSWDPQEEFRCLRYDEQES